MNILSLIVEMKQYKAIDQMAVLFVDLNQLTKQLIEKICFNFSEKKISSFNLRLLF